MTEKKKKKLFYGKGDTDDKIKVINEIFHLSINLFLFFSYHDNKNFLSFIIECLKNEKKNNLSIFDVFLPS